MKKIFSWLDEYILFIISGFLLAFIPLYPKLPLFDVIPGYIVRIRIEDFFIAGALLVWCVQLIRRKNSFGPNPLFLPMMLYLGVGIISMLSAVFLINTVPFEALHINKMVLHFLRRVEYFSLFFIFFSSIKTIRQVKWLIGILVATIIGVTLYGYGQKYFYWPAFSTMNREFAKGWVLYLTQHARVLSTFGGHYDLAAFTMMILLALWSLFFGIRSRISRIGILVVLAGAFWLLILTASRISFLAYLAGLWIIFFLWAFKKGIRWAIVRYIVVTVLSIGIMLSFGDLSERFTKLLKIDQRISGIKSLVLKPFGAVPREKALFLENNIAAVTSKSDMPPIPVNPGVPNDVTENIPDGFIATESGGIATFAAIPRTYSQNALVYDLSTGIRLDALWPRAIKGFLRNPIVGSGYSTLTKVSVEEFTEAESTDNDFLRALGETGILGFITFFGIFGTILWIIIRSFVRVRDGVIASFLIGFIAALCGLLVNALYIDVFEASKVAFSFWALTGIALGSIKVMGADFAKQARFPEITGLTTFRQLVWKRIINFIHGDIFPLLLILCLAFTVRLYKIDAPLADWHSWRQADTSAVTRNFVRHGINLLYPTYDDLSSIASGMPNPKGLRMVEFPLYNLITTVIDKVGALSTVEHSGRITSIFMSLGTLIFLFFLVKRYLDKRTAIITGLLFAVLPYNIYYSRVILPEPTLVFFSTGMLTFFDSWVRSDKKRYYLLSLMFGMCALLIKFSMVFLVFPMAYLIWRKWKLKAFTNPWLYLYVAGIVAPFIWWRWWIAHFPEGIPAYTWLLNGNGIRFKGAFFWWLFAERIGKLILGGWGLPLLVLGFLSPSKKEGWLFHWWLFSMMVYLVVFATGNIQHDYYQSILIPILVIFLAKGIEFLITAKKIFISQATQYLLIIICVVFMLAFGWYQVRDYFNINHPEIVEAGREFDRVVHNNKATVIAPYGGDTAFLYQTGRAGWPIMEGSIDDMIKKGAHFFISVKADEVTNEAVKEATDPKGSKKGFKIIEQTPYFVIIQLVPNNKLPQ